MNSRTTLIIIAVLAALVISMGGVILYGLHQQTVADGIADTKIAAEKQAAEERKKEDDARHESTEKKLDALEQQKNKPITALDVLAMIRAAQPQAAVPVAVPARDNQGNELPDAPKALLFQGAALDSYHNRELSCQQCEIKRDDLVRDVASRDKDIAGLKESLKASEKARKKSKWRKVGDAGVKGLIFFAGYAAAKATDKK